jgi:DNA-binding protein H-NS
MAKLNLKSMSPYDLIELRGQLETVLATKVAAERKALEDSLAKLDGLGGKRGRRGRGGSVLAGKKVAPKYRGPEGETWTGRGLKPKWLQAAISEGKLLEDFLIAEAGAEKAPKAKKMRKAPKAGKVRKAKS